MKLLTITTTLALAASCHAATINIMFHNGGVTVANLDTAADGTVVSAGSNGSDTWNHVQNNGGDGLSFSGKTLNFADGTSATGVTLDVSAGYASFNSNYTNDDNVMMDGFYAFNGSESLTIHNLGSLFTGAYRVTIYGDSDANTTNGTRFMNYTIDSVTKTISDSGKFSGTFTEGVNYVVFDNLTLTDLTIIGGATGNGGRSAINGMIIESIESVPEPSNLAMFGVAGLGLMLRRRR